MEQISYEGLDPGIRETVRRLRDAGFSTTDSGDGITKFLPGSGYDEEEVIAMPHVYIMIRSRYLIEETRRLYKFLKDSGVNVTSQSEARSEESSGGWVEASYDPADDVALIGLFRVNDDSWPRLAA